MLGIRSAFAMQCRNLKKLLLALNKNRVHMQNYRTDKKLYFFFCKRKTNWITIKQNWSSSNALLLEVKFSYVTINHDFKLWFLYHGGLAVVNCPCTYTRLARKRTLAQREFQCLKSCLRKTRGEIGSVEWYRWRKSLLRVNFCIYQAQKKLIRAILENTASSADKNAFKRCL